MNTIGENSKINTYSVSNENTVTASSAKTENKVGLDDTAAILNLSEEAFGDGKGYGILQWTHSARKNHLLSTTYSMGLEVSDINAQLAYFRKEMTTVLNGVDYVQQWENLKATENYIDACDVFMEEIECPEVNNYDDREGFANVIYNAMHEGNFV